MAKKINTIADLIPDAANLNKGTERGRYLLETSVSKLGLGRSVLADKNGTLIAGNKTTEVAGELGMDKVRVIETDGTELIVVQRTDLDMTDPNDPRARQLAFADNQVGAQNLAWDAQALLAAAQADDLSDFVRDDELKAMIESAQEEESNTGGNSNVDAEPQIDKAEELREKWGVETGQLWQLGEHRIICGDCTDRAVVDRVMGGEKADITFTSPPYNAGKTPTENKLGTDGKYKDYSDDLTQDNYFELLDKFTLRAFDASDFVFVNIQMLSGNKSAFLRYLSEHAKRLADIAIWDKQRAQPAMAQNVMNSQFEFILVFGEVGASRRMPGNFRGTVPNVYHGKPQSENDLGSDVHAATMPLDFAEWVVSNFSNMSVYEPFSGSGTTLIACERLGRKCRAVEISPAYVAVALQRWADATGKTPKLLQ